MSKTEEPEIVARAAGESESEPESEPVESVALMATDHASYLPVPGEWAIICQQADVLAQSDLVPAAYRRKPANVVLATLAGRPYGFDASLSMRSFHVIEGTPTMKPEIMLALVRRAGHSVKGEATPKGSTVTGTRADNGDTLTVSFTLESAEQAGLCEIRDGKPYARSSKGGKLPWEQYPEDMMWARCLSKLCRRLFSDVVLGAGYTAEELGGVVNEYGDVIDAESMELPAFAQPTPEPEQITAEDAAALKARASGLPEDGKVALREMVQRGGRHLKFSEFTPGQATVIEGMILAVEKRATAGEWGVWPPANVDGEVVDGDGPVDAVVCCYRCQEPEEDCVCEVAGVESAPAMDAVSLEVLLGMPAELLPTVDVEDLRDAASTLGIGLDGSEDCEDIAALILAKAGPM